jgi:hypothetical protein
MFIPDLDFFAIPDPDPGVKKYRILESDSGSATLENTYVIV